MERADGAYRIKLLGELQVFSPDGMQLPLPRDRVMQRLLITLALRSGQPRRLDELVDAVWPGKQSFGRDSRSLETPASRLRSKLRLPIPSRRGQAFYKLEIDRQHVDALDFMDAVRSEDLDSAHLARLLSLWRGDPRTLYAELPVNEWEPLMQAVDRLVQRLTALPVLKLQGLQRELDAFMQILPSKTAGLNVVFVEPSVEPRHRLLIVENEVDVAHMLRTILYEYCCTVVTTLEEAMKVVSESLMNIDAAVIDLHLTDRLDSAGLEILGAIRDQRPDLPRLLITASPPSGSQEQLRKTYGLFDILIKGADGYSASGIRDAVGKMFSESETAARCRVTALFESQSSQIHRTLMRRMVVARRGVRSGEMAAYSDLEKRSSQLEQFDIDSNQVREILLTAPIVDCDRLVGDYVDRWNAIEGENKEMQS
jgi:DNA-binding response OmpR family regulator